MKTQNTSAPSGPAVRAALALLEIDFDDGYSNEPARVIDRETKLPELIDLLFLALPSVEEAEQFNKPSCRTLSKRIRAVLAELV